MSTSKSTATDAPRTEPAADDTTGLDDRFRVLFHAEFGYVSRVLRRFGVSTLDLDDAAQETFVAVHRHFDTYDPSRPLRPWLVTFAYHVASNYRRLARHRHEADDDGSSRDPSADPNARHEAKNLLLCALDELPLVKRDVFVMHDIENLEAKEIASKLDIPVNTVYSRLRLAREELARLVRRLEETSS